MWLGWPGAGPAGLVAGPAGLGLGSGPEWGQVYAGLGQGWAGTRARARTVWSGPGLGARLEARVAVTATRATGGRNALGQTLSTPT